MPQVWRPLHTCRDLCLWVNLFYSDSDHEKAFFWFSLRCWRQREYTKCVCVCTSNVNPKQTVFLVFSLQAERLLTIIEKLPLIFLESFINTVYTTMSCLVSTIYFLFLSLRSKCWYQSRLACIFFQHCKVCKMSFRLTCFSQHQPDSSNVRNATISLWFCLRRTPRKG